MKKIILLILLFIVVLNLIYLNNANMESFFLSFNSVEGESFITTTNKTNSKLSFYYFIPPKVNKDLTKTYPLLVCMPGMSGYGKSMVTSEIKKFANDSGFVILAPTFILDQENFAARTSYHYPRAWSGDALIKIIKHLNEAGIKTSKLYMFGFSAGAQYVLRFSIWRPDLVEAAAAYSFGETIVPDKTIPVKFFVSVGKSDEQRRIDNADIFFESAKKLNISVQKKYYDGIGHILLPYQVNDDLNFFRSVKVSTD